MLANEVETGESKAKIEVARRPVSLKGRNADWRWNHLGETEETKD